MEGVKSSAKQETYMNIDSNIEPAVMEQEQHIQVELCPAADKYIICNMYPFYLYDLSEIWERLPNRYGVFEEDDCCATLAQQSDVFKIWWRHPGVLFPFLIRVNGIPAGFALVSTPPYVPAGEQVEYFLHEFFLMRPFRGKGIAQQAAKYVFDSFSGRWALHTNPTGRNMHTRRFWRQLLADYTSYKYDEQPFESDENGPLLTFRFVSQASPSSAQVEIQK